VQLAPAARHGGHHAARVLTYPARRVGWHFARRALRHLGLRWWMY
jgi:hypothetical protein